MASVLDIGTGSLDHQVGPRIPKKDLGPPAFFISQPPYPLKKTNIPISPQISFNFHPRNHFSVQLSVKIEKLGVSIKEQKGAPKFGLYGSHRGKNDTG